MAKTEKDPQIKLLHVMARIEEKYEDRVERKMIDLGSVTRDDKANKFSVLIDCSECEAQRRVFTSDLFQVHLCEDCTKESRKNRKTTKKAA